MLVLTRKSNQSIMIGDDIEVSVLSIMGEKVRIGIQAPRDIPVFRKEVYLEIQQENVAAGASARAEVDDALKRLSSRPQVLAEQVVQRLEHRDRHDDGGGDQRDHEQPEAHRAALVGLQRVALAGAALGLGTQPFGALLLLLELLEEGGLEFGQALAHSHRRANLAPLQDLVQHADHRPRPARRAPRARRPNSAAWATLGGMVSVTA
jgi:carbon storage regulator